MATLTKDDIGSTWIDLVADLSLVNSTSYIIQNVSPYSMNFKEKGTPPTSTEFGHIIVSGETWTFTVGSEKIYVKNQGTDDAKKVHIALSVST